MGMAYLSATRGWIISIGLIILSTFLVSKKLKKLTGFIVTIAILIMLGLSNPAIKKQSEYSIDRLTTLEALAEGDVTAKGTLRRLDVRGPKVMKKWSENPILGWGYSDITWKYVDPHVGNQTLLMMSGILGFSLFVGFFISVSLKMYAKYLNLPKSLIQKKVFLYFIVYLIGWFLLHTTSAQQFSYGGIPSQVIPQAIYLSLCALIYSKANELFKIS
jgi:O-antigen ligase